MPAAKPWPARFWAFVDKTDDCWNWTGSSLKGYGQLQVKGKTLKAHRISYELEVGPIPEGLVLDHLCRNRACVNPAHLEAVRQAVNAQRGDIAKLTAEQVEEIRERLRSAEYMVDIARDYGVNEDTIWTIASGIAWREDYTAPPEPIRPDVKCRECGVQITTGRRHKKYCCPEHRQRYNQRKPRALPRKDPNDG